MSRYFSLYIFVFPKFSPMSLYNVFSHTKSKVILYKGPEVGDAVSPNSRIELRNIVGSKNTTFEEKLLECSRREQAAHKTRTNTTEGHLSPPQ